MKPVVMTVLRLLGAVRQYHSLDAARLEAANTGGVVVLKPLRGGEVQEVWVNGVRFVRADSEKE